MKDAEKHGFNLICSSCYELDEMDFKKIKEYLHTNPCAKIYEVVNALDMSVKKIKRYLRESRLEILEKNNRFLFCEMCSKPIQSGKYCDECYKAFHHEYKVIYTGIRQSNQFNRYKSLGNSNKAVSI